MTPTLMALSLFAATLVAAPSVAQVPTGPPLLTREDIKAARDKFDRDMKLDTKRPWQIAPKLDPDVVPEPPKPSR